MARKKVDEMLDIFSAKKIDFSKKHDFCSFLVEKFFYVIAVTLTHEKKSKSFRLLFRNKTLSKMKKLGESIK